MSFSLFGIPVRIQPIFWLVALVLGAPRGTSPREIAELAIWVAVLFVSILAHELGHAFAMRAYGRSPSIELWGLGGLTHWGDGPPPTPGKDILVSLAGPGAGLLLGAIVFGIGIAVKPAAGSLGEVLFIQALWINVVWGLVNLAPILPLDGGHVLESSLGWFGGQRGRRVAYGISLVLAVAVIAWALSQRRFWIAFLGLWCASISWRKWSEKPAPDRGPAQPVHDEVRTVWQALMQGETDRAVQLAERALASLPPGAEHDPSRAELYEALAWARLEAGDDTGALDAAKHIPGKPSDLLEARLMVADGRLAEGLTRLEKAFEAGRNSLPALVLSSVYIGEERPDLTLEMLRSKRGAKLSPETHLTVGAQLFHAQKYELSLGASELAFERFQKPVFAYNAACSLARLGRIDEGLQWLERAVEGGFAETEQLDTDPDLSQLRDDARFAEIRSRVPS